MLKGGSSDQKTQVQHLPPNLTL